MSGQSGTLLTQPKKRIWQVVVIWQFSIILCLESNGSDNRYLIDKLSVSYFTNTTRTINCVTLFKKSMSFDLLWWKLIEHWHHIQDLFLILDVQYLVFNLKNTGSDVAVILVCDIFINNYISILKCWNAQNLDKQLTTDTLK